MARLRTAASSTQAQQKPVPSKTTRNTRAALREKTNTTKAPTHTDGEDDEIVVKHVGTKRAGTAATTQGANNPITTRISRNSGSPKTAALSDRPPAAISTRGNDSSRTGRKMPSQHAKGQRTAATRDAQQESLGNAASRTRGVQNRRQKPSTSANDSPIERAEFSISPSPPAIESTASKRKSGPRSSQGSQSSARKVHGTPAAAESSVLALKNFKRRPRQPSMLAMVQQYHQSQKARASVGGPTEWELDAAVKDRGTYDDAAALGTDGEDDDFAPEAEGTPAHLRAKLQMDTARYVPPLSQSSGRDVTSLQRRKKRVSTSIDDSAATDPSLSTKRRKTSNTASRNSSLASTSLRNSLPQANDAAEVQIIDSSPPRSSSGSANIRLSIEPVLTDLGEEQLAVPSTDPMELDKRASTLRPSLLNGEENDVPNGTMADPISSSPSAIHAEEDLIATTQPPQLRPSLAGKRIRKQKDSRPLNTAALQDLLPRKRQPLRQRRRKNEYDFGELSEEEVSEDDDQLEDDHEDELSRPSKRRTKALSLSKQSKVSAKSRQGKGPAPARKPAGTVSRKSGAKNPSRTYGKVAGTSDQENDDNSWSADAADEAEESILPDVSITSVEAMKSKELQEVAKKFADIDEWEGMEFESDNEHRSSSQGWR